jgi:nitroreductase
MESMSTDLAWILTGCCWLRETRLYLDKPVPDEVAFRVLEAGRPAGSAKNRQRWEFILVRDRERLEKLSRYGQFASHLPNASFAVVIVVSDKYIQDRSDAGRAEQNMMLAAHFLGVGSCPITFHDEEGAKAFLKIPKELRIAVCIAFGYSAEGRPRGCSGKRLRRYSTSRSMVAATPELPEPS